MKILLIEDDEKLNKALKLSLQRAGFAVDSFTEGAKGEKHFAMNNIDYDLLILDLGLPDKSGFEICRNIREWKIATPVLILTGNNQIKDKVAALDCGADDYLTKPFSIPELEARVRALLRRPKEVVPTELTVGDIALNSATRKVTRGGNPIPLTLKEFGILEYLMRNSNRVVTRDQILDHVWDFNFNSFSNIVDVHVTSLRKKLNVKKGENCIETVRGVGYKLKV